MVVRPVTTLVIRQHDKQKSPTFISIAIHLLIIIFYYALIFLLARDLKEPVVVYEFEHELD